MKIAPYYQKLLNLGLQAAKSLEPITFVGMFNSGTGYLFTLSMPLFASELSPDVTPIAIDLSGLTTKQEVSQEIAGVLSGLTKIDVIPEYSSLVKTIVTLAGSTRVVLLLYFGQEGTVDPGLFLLLNRLRNLLGWKFSYVIFTTPRIFQDHALVTPLVEKILKRNIVQILPLNEENSVIVLGNYEERYNKKLPQREANAVITLSGGNPGLIKALYLQAIASKKWVKPDLLEEQLYFRLQGITNDLTDQAKSLLLGKKLSKIDPFLVYHLECYGYGIRKAGKLIPFTPLLVDFIKNYAACAPKKTQNPSTSVDTMILHFTKSQRNILEYLQVHPGELISKDSLAQVLWGEQWADRYSDWAIDQLVSTLREKMSTIKHDGKIVTKKGEGIIFLPEGRR